MSIKKFRGKFRMSTSSISSQISIEEWTKYDDRLLDCVYKVDIAKLKETLKRRGCSPVKLCRDGQTAMHIAVRKSLVDCIDCFLAERPDLSTTDSQGCTVYHIAASNGDTIVLKKLLDYSRWNLDIPDVRNKLPIHCAVIGGDIACVKLLLDSNTPTDGKDNDHKTPLLYAIEDGNEKIAATLILHGIDINVVDDIFRTPLMIACSKGLSQVVALLISKGADITVKDSDGRSLETIASEAGHPEILDILKNRADSGIVDMDAADSVEVDGKEETKPTTPLTPTVKISDEGVSHMNGDAHPSEKHVRTTSSSSAKRLSMGKYDESSFTSSIIESLMGFDVSSDTISEMSATEDQLHMKMEEQHKNLKHDINLRDLRIEELEAEMVTLKSKLKIETEMRFAAENEVLQLKSQVELLVEKVECKSSQEELDVTFDSEYQLPADGTVDEDDTKDDIVQDDEEKELHSEKQDEDPSIIDDEEEKEVQSEQSEEDHFDFDSDSDSDESVSEETGYRKKSLGTAKQHIDMLEEHILGLEDDLVNKDDEISDLEVKLKNARELVDLNNNTTVSVELFNELKSEKITERTTFKDQIRALQDDVDKLEQTKQIFAAEKMVLQEQVENESGNTKNLKLQLEDVQEKMMTLQKQLDDCTESYQKTIRCYRENILALHQNEMAVDLKNVLHRIVKLRSG